MPGYDTAIETVEVDGIGWQIERLSDRQQFADADGASERAGISSATWSIFGQLWPSGWALAQRMATLPVDGVRILELGCGLALSSLVLARRGAAITASDHHPLAPLFLAANARRNGIAAPAFVELQWADPTPAVGRFDVIIASDVMYERGHAELVAGAIERLALEHARIIVTDPGRGQIGRLGRLLGAQGFTGTIEAIALGATPDAPSGGRMLRYSR
jgi:predicted nicotinamide N-methyase